MERRRIDMLAPLRRLIRWAGLDAARCPICTRIINTKNGTLCPACAEDLQPRAGGFCPRCGDIFGDEDQEPTLCGQCRTTPQPWERLYFHNIYAGKLRDMILGYKFNSGIGRTRLLADMASRCFHDGEGRSPDVIVPVPLHKKRLLWRGYNQSAEICRALARELGRPILHDGLVRTRNTQPQTRLGMTERQENIKEAFSAAPDKVKGNAVLLVDDVYTTGATLKECAKTLRKAGAAGVEVLVLARAIE